VYIIVSMMNLWNCWLHVYIYEIVDWLHVYIIISMNLLTNCMYILVMWWLITLIACISVLCCIKLQLRTKDLRYVYLNYLWFLLYMYILY
jgi:hypothetical protein